MKKIDEINDKLNIIYRKISLGDIMDNNNNAIEHIWGEFSPILYEYLATTKDKEIHLSIPYMTEYIKGQLCDDNIFNASGVIYDITYGINKVRQREIIFKKRL